LYFPEIFIGYIGMLFMGGLFVSGSMFFSSLTKNQVVAFLSSVIFFFIFMILGSDFLATVLPKFILDFLNYFSPLYHLQNFINGLIDLRSVFYFFSLSATFIFLTIINLEKRE